MLSNNGEKKEVTNVRCDDKLTRKGLKCGPADMQPSRRSPFTCTWKPWSPADSPVTLPVTSTGALGLGCVKMISPPQLPPSASPPPPLRTAKAISGWKSCKPSPRQKWMFSRGSKQKSSACDGQIICYNLALSFKVYDYHFYASRT